VIRAVRATERGAEAGEQTEGKQAMSRVREIFMDEEVEGKAGAAGASRR